MQRLVYSWPKRAGVRHGTLDDVADSYDPALPDYPLALLPFRDHPAFVRLSAEKQNDILTLAWLAYNRRVIHIEETVTNPAIGMILRGELPGAEQLHVRQALQQTQIDEQYHLMLHELAMHKTMALRGIDQPVQFPPSLIYVGLVRLQEGAADWQKELLCLIWAAVSEMTINGYLDMLANDTSIQPAHTYICKLHNKDEYSHNKIFVEITKSVFQGLNAEQRAFFLQVLPEALALFAGQDFSVWQAVLERAGVAEASAIIADCSAEAARKKMISDTSATERLAEELAAYAD
ncbi:diiron oxygenase [Pseudoduganella armeniaca]|uniref:diiron oxygenase n=1 Tax=Pseudoduganella armeniaca TaxID=2072590 RepID=UPI0015E650A3|nr:diiron oxygenase [Pseudoduganella armeniaca]